MEFWKHEAIRIKSGSELLTSKSHWPKHGETVLLRAPVPCSRKGQAWVPEPALPGPDLVVIRDPKDICVVEPFVEQHNPHNQ